MARPYAGRPGQGGSDGNSIQESPIVKLYFMRHAHAMSQMDSAIVTGRSETAPLSPKGREQADTLGDAVLPLGIQAIHSSPSLRAAQTASAIARVVRKPITTNLWLVERSQGNFEGRLKTDVYTPEVIQTIHRDQLRWAPPNGETLLDVEGRIALFLAGLHPAASPTPILVVTHLMVLWAVFHLCTSCRHDILPALHVDNGAVVEVDLDPAFWRPGGGDGLRLLRWNARI